MSDILVENPPITEEKYFVPDNKEEKVSIPVTTTHTKSDLNSKLTKKKVQVKLPFATPTPPEKTLLKRKGDDVSIMAIKKKYKLQPSVTESMLVEGVAFFTNEKKCRKIFVLMKPKNDDSPKNEVESEK